MIDINTAAIDNADKRLKEIPNLDFGIAAIADYDNGLTTGFKDGAHWVKGIIIDAACELFERYVDNFKTEGGVKVTLVNKNAVIKSFRNKLNDK